MRGGMFLVLLVIVIGIGMLGLGLSGKSQKFLEAIK